MKRAATQATRRPCRPSPFSRGSWRGFFLGPGRGQKNPPWSTLNEGGGKTLAAQPHDFQSKPIPWERAEVSQSSRFPETKPIFQHAQNKANGPRSRNKANSEKRSTRPPSGPDDETKPIPLGTRNEANRARADETKPIPDRGREPAVRAGLRNKANSREGTQRGEFGPDTETKPMGAIARNEPNLAHSLVGERGSGSRGGVAGVAEADRGEAVGLGAGVGEDPGVAARRLTPAGRGSFAPSRARREPRATIVPSSAERDGAGVGDEHRRRHWLRRRARSGRSPTSGPAGRRARRKA